MVTHWSHLQLGLLVPLGQEGRHPGLEYVVERVRSLVGEGLGQAVLPAQSVLVRQEPNGI